MVTSGKFGRKMLVLYLKCFLLFDFYSVNVYDTYNTFINFVYFSVYREKFGL